MSLKKTFQEVEKTMSSAIVKQIQNQGHTLTGALERSVSGNVSETGLEGYMLDYGVELNKGVAPGIIQPNDRRHIEELTNYFILRGLSSEEAEQAAVRTTRRHFKEGMPTRKSARFSKTGQRKYFIEQGNYDVRNKVDEIMDSGMDEFFNEQFNKQKSEKI